MAHLSPRHGMAENNYDEIDKEIYAAHRKRQQKVGKTVESEFLDEIIKANDINKRVIGKVMVTYCGNEGAEHDERTASLRKLLQAVIDYIQVNPKVNWHNAEITVYDLDDNSFRIISGLGKHQYVVSDDGSGKADIMNTSNKIQKAPKTPTKEKQSRDHPYGFQHGTHSAKYPGRHDGFPHHPGQHGKHHDPHGHHHNGQEDSSCVLC